MVEVLDQKLVDEILTYRYVKPRVQWFLNEESSLTDPFRIAQELEGYAYNRIDQFIIAQVQKQSPE